MQRSSNLVQGLDVIGDEKGDKRTELCKTWGKVQDEHCLFFFDDGAKANFISPELATKLGIRPHQLPPERPKDHAIDIIPESSPPNRPPYRVNLAQQEEIMTQANELLEKGLIQPSSSPYCSLVLLVHKKDGS